MPTLGCTKRRVRIWQAISAFTILATVHYALVPWQIDEHQDLKSTLISTSFMVQHPGEESLDDQAFTVLTTEDSISTPSFGASKVKQDANKAQRRVKEPTTGNEMSFTIVYEDEEISEVYSPFSRSREPRKLVMLGDAYNDYFRQINGVLCFVQGTDVSASLASHGECICKRDYFGEDCGIPAAVWYGVNTSEYPEAIENLTRREVPRRVIHGIAVNHELDLTEVRFHELGNSVDLYIISESNHSAAGNPKRRYFREHTKRGFLRKFRRKVLYVIQNSFPKEGLVNGWVADSYMRKYIGLVGLHKVDGVRPDDIFLLFDADEIPKPEIVTFLKLYDGYTEPFSFNLRWSTFGFFWKRFSVLHKEERTTIVAGCTVGFLNHVYDNDAMLIRKNTWYLSTYALKTEAYEAKGGKVETMPIGDDTYSAGYHCSYCFDPESIKVKLISAQRSDGIRWGNYPEKLQTEYILNLIETGVFFDNTISFQFIDLIQDTDYAPTYMLSHFDKYMSIILHPDNRTKEGVKFYKNLIKGRLKVPN